ncbi:Tn7-like element transposition protein TnsE [Idiomarina sp. HP20-50]|uniref:Tn7-like element transposition protein TnsE n=1 Tax=Idiomarina sp. HP20-50 TaxID=3070813 RepID=UPI00294B6856|nr:Tn7-like element transposition protein TnsE [Idiomarina sp. HP20-50]MDV6316542.1 Tn7-like element transposition protein TnsE [Idiomarina sp. HP20-50]
MADRFKNIENNSKLLHLGDLFRSTTAKYWRINAWLSPIQNKRHANFSNLPMLARGRVLNATDDKPKRDRASCSITRESIISECNLSEFPEFAYGSLAKAESRQKGFLIKTPGKPSFIIPQLELARVLFLHSGYLCRAALTSETLTHEFDVQERLNEGKVIVNVLKLSAFPKNAFDDAGTRRMLAWLLTDRNARKSFESIFRHYKLFSRVNNGWEMWTFSFEPPEMLGWSFTFHGRADETNNKFFVEEITDLTFHGSLPDRVLFQHDSFKRYENRRTGGTPNGSPWTHRPDEHEINDDETSSNNNEPVILRNDTHTINFLGHTQTAKVNQVVESDTGASNPEPNEVASEEVSTDEPTEGGKLPAADFSGPTDETDLTRMCESRFEAFNHMLELLQKNGVTLLTKETTALPQSGRGQKHLLKNGEPRVICCAEVSYEGRHAYILEVDTSDGLSQLSTKIFVTSSDLLALVWTNLIEGITKGGLSWPAELIKVSFSERDRFSINHPKNEGAGGGAIPTDQIGGWANKFLSKIKQND